MSITASGFYLPSFEKMMIDTLGQSLEAETHKGLLVNDSYTPDFTAHDFRNDITNEVTGTGWAAGGVALTGTEITLAAGTLTFDATDVSVSSTTLTNVMAYVFYTTVGADTTDQLILLSDFVTAVSTTAGTFAVNWHALGIATIDLTP